jgi:hypothetical protein
MTFDPIAKQVTLKFIADHQLCLHYDAPHIKPFFNQNFTLSRGKLFNIELVIDAVANLFIVLTSLTS